MTIIQPSPIGSLLAQLKLRQPVKNHTDDKRRDEDSDCSGTGLIERHARRENRPIQKPVKSAESKPSEINTLMEQLIISVIPVIKNGIQTGSKSGAQAIIDSLEWKLIEDPSEISDQFKTNSTQVLFIILDKQSLNERIKSKAFNLLIKLATDPTIEVMTAGCEKLLDIHKEHGLPPQHVQSVTKCLVEAKKILFSNNKYPTLLQRIINIFESE